jgi:hypothetical protein
VTSRHQKRADDKAGFCNATYFLDLSFGFDRLLPTAGLAGLSALAH